MGIAKEATAALERPAIQRLQALGTGLEVGEVLGDRILVQTIEPETIGTRVERTGTLYLPEDAKERNKPKPCTGIIIKLGTDVAAGPLAEGVAVMFSKYAGTDFVISEREGLKILEVREVMCTLVLTDTVIAPVAAPAAV